MNNIKGYELVNVEKVDRALNGVQKNNSTRVGGIGNGAYFDVVWKREDTELASEEVEVLETALLAEYDKLGGLIKKNGDKVKMGSFYNFKAKKAHDAPKVFFTYKVNGRFVDVPEGVELPGEVKAVKFLEEEEAKVTKKTRKSKI